jgi:AcrR family transcriptional regulator
MSARESKGVGSELAACRRHWRAGVSGRGRHPALVADFQRSRIVGAATSVAFEHGYERMTATAVVTSARVSRKTFYDLFESREDCYLAVLEGCIERIAVVVVPAYEGSGAWAERVRAGLVALLELFEREPETGALVVAYLIGCGPDSWDLRTRVLDVLGQVLASGRPTGGRRQQQLSPLTEEAVIGSVLTILHARLRQGPAGLHELASDLMWMITLPYLGAAVARKQLTRAAPAPVVSQAAPAASSLQGLDMRLTYRTAKVLEVIADWPGASNAEIAERVQVADPGQISKLLKRLARLGLIENTGEGQRRGAANAWHLTPRGSELESSIRRKPMGAPR